jgi:hypothetical protein
MIFDFRLRSGGGREVLGWESLPFLYRFDRVWEWKKFFKLQEAARGCKGLEKVDGAGWVPTVDS